MGESHFCKYESSVSLFMYLRVENLATSTNFSHLNLMVTTNFSQASNSTSLNVEESVLVCAYPTRYQISFLFSCFSKVGLPLFVVNLTKSVHGSNRPHSSPPGVSLDHMTQEILSLKRILWRKGLLFSVSLP